MDSSNQKIKLPVGTVVRHQYEGSGRILKHDGEMYVVQFKKGVVRVPVNYMEMKAADQPDDAELFKIKQAMKEVLGDYGWVDSDLELGKRWNGGTLILKPGDDTQPKEIPLDVFFKKIIGVREKLRVLEQKINNNPNLSNEEKVELEGYITRSYGSLTTFNVLFSAKESYFKGSGD